MATALFTDCSISKYFSGTRRAGTRTEHQHNTRHGYIRGVATLSSVMSRVIAVKQVTSLWHQLQFLQLDCHFFTIYNKQTI